MFEVLTGLFDMTGFPPRKECGPGWTPALIWLHVTSDLFIWLAYLSIPLVLLYFTRRRDLPYPRLFVLFALFILACGTTHLIDALIFEYPIYWFAGVMKGVTAVVSWATVIALVPVVPRVMTAVAAAGQPGAVTKQHQALPPNAAPRSSGRPRAYIVAVLAAVLAVLVRAALNPLLKNDHIFVVALLAVVYVSWQHGFGPAVLCLLVGVGGYAYYFIAPRRSLMVDGLDIQLALALFFFCGVACAALGEAQRVAQRQARVALAAAMTRQEELESEVTRRRVVEAALRQRETDLVAAQRASADALARLNAFLDNAPLGIAFFDPELRYVRINTFLAAANGQPVEAHTGRQLTELIPDFPPEVAAAYRRTAGPDGQPFTTQFRRPDPRAPGTTRAWRATAFPVRDAEGEVLGAGVIAQDVTAALKAEEELRVREERFRAMAQTVPSILWTAAPDGTITWVNDRWLEYCGITAEQNARGWPELVLHPDDYDRCVRQWTAALAAGTEYEIEIRNRRHDGAYRWFITRAIPLRDAGGAVRAWFGVTTDIHDHKTAVDALRESEERFRSMADSSPALIWLSEPDGRRTYFNKTWVEFTGRPADEQLGSGWVESVHPDDRERYLSMYSAALTSRRPFELEYRLRRHDGADRWVLARGTPRFAPSGGGFAGFVGLCLDVTEAKRAEAEVRRSEERYRLLTEAVPHIVWNADDAGEVTYFNQRWLDYTGTALETAAGRGWLEAVHPDDRDRVFAAWCDTIDRPTPGRADRFVHEFRLRDAGTGAYRWFLSAAVSLRRPDGSVDQWIGSMADIHDQKTAAEAIRESEAFRRSVFENSPDCLKIIDLDGRVLEMNEGGCRLMEIDDFSTVRGERWSDLWPAANRETIREAVEIARAGRVGRFQGFCPTAKGTPKYWDVSVAAVPSADGTPYRLIGVSRDVTEQRRAEDAVRASEQRFRTLTEAVPQMVWTADPKGEVTFFNRRWDEYTAVPLDVGRAAEWANNPVHPDDTDRLRAGWQLAVAQEADGYSEEFRLRRAADGAYRWMLSVAVPLRDSVGTLTEWVGTLTDIDDQKRQTETLEHMVRARTVELEETNLLLTAEVAERRAAEQQVRAVAAELERSNDELEKFAYVASHDLQEPLRKIQAFGDRLQIKCRDALPDTGKEYVDRMLVAAGRMRRLIDDLLTFSRVTTQRRPYKRLDLERLVREVVSDLEVRITQSGGTVHVGALPDLDADPSQMRQLFQNLIANAVKFYRPGVPPVVTVEGEPFTPAPADPDEGEPVPMVRITVRDNGIGFDEKYRDRIFDVFQRLHGRDEYEGTGVGLAICRKIVERHGGLITAHGKDGEGATFVVVLPARQFNPREATTDDDHSKQTDHDIDGR